MSKGGFGGGAASLTIPMMAFVIDPITAAAIVLPILIAMDAVAVWKFRHSWDKVHLMALLPAAIIGIVIASLLMGALSTQAMKSHYRSDRRIFLLKAMAIQQRTKIETRQNSWLLLGAGRGLYKHPNSRGCHTCQYLPAAAKNEQDAADGNKLIILCHRQSNQTDPLQPAGSIRQNQSGNLAGSNATGSYRCTAGLPPAARCSRKNHLPNSVPLSVCRRYKTNLGWSALNTPHARQLYGRHRVADHWCLYARKDR